ncbi:MAG: YdeI/OmpD-associated family protein [Puia sp.]
MALSLAQKLRIKEGTTQLTIHAPADFAEQLQPLPPGVKITRKAKRYDQLHWFVKNKAELEKDLEGMLDLLRDQVVCWIYYPKGSSGIQTDLARDKGWEELLKQGLQWLSLISFNDHWSAFGIRLKTGADQKNESKRPERAVFDYVDPKTKTINPPEGLVDMLKKNKKAAAFFNALSFTNKKAYVEWIVSAKREGTQKERLRATMERLEKGWKNPANR